MKYKKPTNLLKLAIRTLLLIFIISDCKASGTSTATIPASGTSDATESRVDPSAESATASTKPTENGGFAVFKAKDPFVIGGKIKTLLKFESDLDGDGTAEIIGLYCDERISKLESYLLINSHRFVFDYTYDAAYVVPIKDSKSRLLAFCSDNAQMVLIRYDGAKSSSYTDDDIMELLPEMRSSCNDDNTITFEIPDLNIMQKLDFQDYSAPSSSQFFMELESINSETELELEVSRPRNYIWEDVDDDGFMELMLEYVLYGNISNFTASLYLTYSFGDEVKLTAAEVSYPSFFESDKNYSIQYFNGWKYELDDDIYRRKERYELKREKHVIFPEREQPFISEYHPILWYGRLLGGIHNGQWIRTYDLESPESELVQGGETYQLYNKDGYVGEDIGSIARVEGLVVSQTLVRMKNGKTAAIAINADWQVLPRISREIAMNTTFDNIIRAELDKRGLNSSPVNVTNIVQCDIEGDGQSEYIITAYYNKGEDIMFSDPGDYSIVLVHSEKKDREDEVLYAWVSDDWPFDVVDDTYTMDLNGDGILEIIMVMHYYEGQITAVASKADTEGEFEFALSWFNGL